MEIHQVKCDKCGKIEQMEKNEWIFSETHRIPRKWVHVVDLEKSLCPICSKKYKKLRSSFFRSKLEAGK